MKNAPSLLTLFGVGLLAVTIALDTFIADGLSAVVLALMTGVASICLALSLWRQRPSEERRYISLGAVFCLYYGISYGFAILGAPPQFAPRLLPDGLEDVNLISVPAGILAWLVGYKVVHLKALTGGARELLLPQRTIGPVGPLTLVVVYATTVLVRVWQIASGGGFGYLRDVGELTTSTNSLAQYLDVYGQLGIVVLGLAIIASGNVHGESAGYRRVYLWMIPFEAVLRLLAGNKSGPLLLAAMVVFALIAIGKVSLSPLKLAAVGLVAVLIVFPVVGAYRDILRPEQGQQLSPVEAPGAAVLAIKQTASTFVEGPAAYSHFAFDQTAGRLREIDRAAVSIRAHDAGKPYSPPGEMAQRVETGLIPRVLWPGKPINLYALDVSRNYYRLPNEVISAASLSPVGDGYRYGGLAMVVVALAMVGAFVRFLDEMLAPRHSIWLVPLLVATVPLIRGGDIAGLLVGTVRYFVIVGIFYRVLFVRTGRRSGVSNDSSQAARAASARGRAT